MASTTTRSATYPGQEPTCRGLGQSGEGRGQRDQEQAQASQRLRLWLLARSYGQGRQPGRPIG